MWPLIKEMAEAEKELDKNFEVNGKTYLVRCPKCGKENYALAVSSGVCCWCGYDANKDHKTGDKKELDKDKQV